MTTITETVTFYVYRGIKIAVDDVFKFEDRAADYFEGLENLRGGVQRGITCISFVEKKVPTPIGMMNLDNPRFLKPKDNTFTVDVTRPAWVLKSFTELYPEYTTPHSLDAFYGLPTKPFGLP